MKFGIRKGNIFFNVEIQNKFILKTWIHLKGLCYVFHPLYPGGGGFHGLQILQETNSVLENFVGNLSDEFFFHIEIYLARNPPGNCQGILAAAFGGTQRLFQ